MWPTCFCLLSSEFVSLIFFRVIALSLVAQGLGSEENTEKALKIVLYSSVPLRFALNEFFEIFLTVYAVMLAVTGIAKLFHLSYERAIIAFGIVFAADWIFQWVLGFFGFLGLVGFAFGGAFQ